MKIGCCICGFSREDDPLGLHVLPMLKDAGYDYVEVSITDFTQLEDAAFRQALACARSAALPIEAGNLLYPATVDLYGAPQDALDWLSKAVDRAAQLGLRVMVFGSGLARACPQGMAAKQAFDALAALLVKAAPLLAQAGVTLVVEPLNRTETDMICNLSQGAQLVRAVSHPNVRLLVDYYHFCLENDALCAQDIPLLAHAHCAEPVRRHCHHVIDAPFRAFLEQLRAGGYEGRLSLEASVESDQADLLAFPQRMQPFR